MSTISYEQSGQITPLASLCPYRGLMPYTEQDVDFFFGREQDSRLIVDNLRAYPISVLYGPSGVGKTSVLRAGVLRLIREDTKRKRQRFGVVETVAAYNSNWRDDPRRILPPVLRSAFLEVTGRDGEPAPDLLDCADVVRACDEREVDLLLVLDQFEEYFLYHDDEADALGRDIADLLVPGSRVSVLISIREDALAKLDRFAAALPEIFDATLRLEHLDRESASEAVLQPLEQFNMARPQAARWSAEPALVDELLDQVTAGRVKVTGHSASGGGRPHTDNQPAFVEAPFLQLVLTRLWQEESDTGSHSIKRSTLESLGGAQQVVREHLDRVVAAFDSDDREVLASIFGHLVTPGGTKIAHTVSDLAAFSGVPEVRVRSILKRLCEGDRRILRETDPIGDDPAARPRFEVFHDVLALAVLDWRQRWIRRREAEEAQEQLVWEKRQAEEQARETRHRLRRTRLLAAVMTLLLVGCLVLAGVAYLSNRKAHEAKAIAEQESLLSRLSGQGDPAKALAMARSAWMHGGGRAAEEAVRARLDIPHPRLELEVGSPVISASYTPDGKSIVSLSRDGRLQIWRRPGGELLRQVDLTPLGQSGQPVSLALIGNQYAVVGVDPGSAQVVSLQSGRVTTLEGTDPFRISAATAESTWAGPLVLTSDGSGKATLWSAGTGIRLRGLGASGSNIDAVALDQSGERAATWDGSHSTVAVWDTRTGRRLASAPLGNTKSVMQLSFSSSGDLLLALDRWSGKSSTWFWAENPEPDVFDSGKTTYETASVGLRGGDHYFLKVADKTATVANLRRKHVRFVSAPGGSDWVNAADVDRSGHLLVTGANDGQVQVSYADRVGQTSPLWRLDGHEGPVNDVHFSPSGDAVLTAGSDGSVREWQVPPRVTYWGDETDHRWLLGARFIPGSHDVVTASYGGKLATFDAASGRFLGAWKNPVVGSEGGGVASLDVSPAGGQIAIGTVDYQTVPVVRQKDGRVPYYDNVGFFLDRTRFSPASSAHLLVAGSNWGSDQVAGWDTRTGKLLWQRKLDSDSEGAVADLAFSGDGSTLAVVTVSGKAWLLDPANGTVRRSFSIGRVTSIDLSYNGRYLATAGEDVQAVKVWDLRDARPVAAQPHTGPSGTLAEVAFSQDPKSSRLAAVGASGRVYVWNRSDLGLLAVLDRSSDAVNSVEFDPNNIDRLVIASDDGTASVFTCGPCSLSDQHLARAARDLAPRHNTAEPGESRGRGKGSQQAVSWIPLR